MSRCGHCGHTMPADKVSLDGVAQAEAHVLGDLDALHPARVGGVVRRVVDGIVHRSAFLVQHASQRSRPSPILSSGA